MGNTGRGLNVDLHVDLLKKQNGYNSLCAIKNTKQRCYDMLLTYFPFIEVLCQMEAAYCACFGVWSRDIALLKFMVRVVQEEKQLVIKHTERYLHSTGVWNRSGPMSSRNKVLFVSKSQIMQDCCSDSSW